MKLRTKIGVVLFLVVLFSAKLMCERGTGLTQALKGPDLPIAQVGYRGESLKKLAFGFDHFLGSLLWVHLLQEASPTRLKSDSVSWEFAEVDTITTLDPNFDVAYHFGSLTVSFFRRDKLGGKLLLEKWVKQRPTLWRAHHMLGMHYFLELNDYKNAAPHVIRASQLPGAPAFITSLGIGLLSQSGAHLSALQSATELFEAAQDPEAKHRLAFRIRGLRWHLQKQALNDAIQSYRKTKGQLPDSLEAVQSFIKPSTDRNLSSLNQKEHRSEDLKNLMAENFFFRLKKDRSSVESTQPDLEKAFENMGVHVQKEIQK